LADFIVEMSYEPEKTQQLQTLHVDRLSNPKEAGVGIVLEGSGELTIKFGFKTSNNQAKCEALLAGLELARDI